MPNDLNATDETSSATVILTGDLRRKLRAYAVRNGISVSEIARTAFKAFLEKHDSATTKVNPNVR
jgi:hypothetical protein